MSAISEILEGLRRARRRLANDGELPTSVLLKKGTEFAISVALAPLWLRTVNVVGDGARTIGRPRIENLGYLELGEGVVLRSTVVPLELTTGIGGRLSIGRQTFINYGVSIGATGSVTIGERVDIGPFVMIFDTTFHDPYDRSRIPSARPVTIGDDVFLGAKCSVMPGVTIGEAAIVATGAVVTHDVPPFSVVAGVPARIVRKLDSEKFIRRR